MSSCSVRLNPFLQSPFFSQRIIETGDTGCYDRKQEKLIRNSS